ncbi:MAG: hypothetical protein FJ134_05285 [Deltaproteobacteria bacterium]|nr:hypothetical protein [Deltaproteobacteria bacterium]
MTLFETDLKRNLKANRARESGKKPFRPSRFTVVSAIIKAYGLDLAFLGLLDRVDERVFHNLAKSAKIKEKPGLELPLFSLTTEDGYYLTNAIKEKLDNPYLNYARDPEELILSPFLYRMNPALPEEILANRHFAWLSAQELEKITENRKLP